MSNLERCHHQVPFYSWAPPGRCPRTCKNYTPPTIKAGAAAKSTLEPSPLPVDQVGSVTSEQSRTTSPLACTQIPKEAAAFATVCRPPTTGNAFPSSSPSTNHLLRMSSVAPVLQADDLDLFSTSCDEDSEVEVISPPPAIKAGAAPPTPKVQFNFFDECGVTELAQKISLDLSGIVKPTKGSLHVTFPKKSLKEPMTDANNNQKEAIKTALKPISSGRKEQLLTKIDLHQGECLAPPTSLSTRSPGSKPACTQATPAADQAVHCPQVQVGRDPLHQSALH